MRTLHRSLALVGTVALASSLVACGGGPQEVNADDTEDQSQSSEAENTKAWTLTEVDDTNVIQFCTDVLGPIDELAESVQVDPSVLDEDQWHGVVRSFGEGERVTCQGIIDGSWRNFNVSFVSYDAKEGFCDRLESMPEWTKDGDLEAVIEAQYVEGGIDPSLTEPILVDALQKIEAGEKQEDNNPAASCN